MLVSSHVLTEVEQLADHAVIISRGQCAATGPLDQLTNRHGGTVTVATPHVHQFTEVVTRTHPHARVEPLDAKRLRVHGMAAADLGDLAFDAQIRIHELTTERGDLEQVFFALTADTAQPIATVQIGG